MRFWLRTAFPVGGSNLKLASLETVTGKSVTRGRYKTVVGKVYLIQERQYFAKGFCSSGLPGDGSGRRFFKKGDKDHFFLCIAQASYSLACSIQKVRAGQASVIGKHAAGVLLVTFSMICAIILPATLALAREPVRSLLEYRQRNVVIQKWDLSCGAAALATLLRYQHGLELTEKQIAASLINRPEYINNPELLRIKQGFSLLDLKRYVERIGLIGDGYGRLELQNLLEMAPLLIPVRLAGYNHFVVFRGLASQRVLIADPAWGNRILKLDDFMDAWIELPDLGRVGFTVTSDSPVLANNRLAPDTLDFVMLR